MLALLGLWAGPLPARAGVSFSAHMLLHLGLVSLAAPLLALGLARTTGGGAPGSAPVLLGTLASVLELLVIWSWHLPALHAAAALSGPAFAAQQAMFFAAALAVWGSAFAVPTRAGAGLGAAVLALGFTHMSMLGILIATAPGLIYPAALCGGGFFGLSPLDDQRLGGVLMAGPGSLPYLAGALFRARRALESGRVNIAREP